MISNEFYFTSGRLVFVHFLEEIEDTRDISKLTDLYHEPLKIYGAPKLCTETTVSNPPVVFSTSSCNVHLFRGPWFMSLSLPKLHCHVKAAEGWQNTSANKKIIFLFTVYMKIGTFFLHYLCRCTLHLVVTLVVK